MSGGTTDQLTWSNAELKEGAKVTGWIFGQGGTGLYGRCGVRTSGDDIFTDFGKGLGGGAGGAQLCVTKTLCI